MLRRPAVHLLRLSKAVGIKDQLRLEEALLRHDTRNWCLLKDGEPTGLMAQPTIVLGIGGKAAKLVELERVHQDRVPLVRRFSGGGTVIVDHDSLFISFIMNTVSKGRRGLAGVEEKDRRRRTTAACILRVLIILIFSLCTSTLTTSYRSKSRPSSPTRGPSWSGRRACMAPSLTAYGQRRQSRSNSARTTTCSGH